MNTDVAEHQEVSGTASDDPVMTDRRAQIEKWKGIALSDTHRVTRTLVLENGPTPGDNVTPVDIHFALDAVAEILSPAKGGDSKAWQILIDGGIVDALCRSFCSTALVLRALLTNVSSGEPPLELGDELRSSCHKALEILFRATVYLRQPPTRKTDKMIIAALKRNWANITATVWDPPSDILQREELHGKIRLLFAQIVARIVRADPNFVYTLYEPDDLTVQIMAQYWKQSQQPLDTMFTTSVLKSLLELKDPSRVTDVRSRNFKSAPSKILSRILLGLGPTLLSSNKQQVKALITTFVRPLIHQTDVECVLDNELFFSAVLQAAKKDQTGHEIWEQVFKSTPLWNAVLRSLKRIAKPSTPSSNTAISPACSEEMDKAENMRVEGVSRLANLLDTVLLEAYSKHPRECEDLVRICANENLFGVLEEVAEVIVGFPGIPRKLAHVLGTIQEVVSKSSTLLKQTFSTQFPRWKIFNVFIMHGSNKYQMLEIKPSGFLPEVTLEEIEKHRQDDDAFWYTALWQTFLMLQSSCMNKAGCGKRGCGNTGTIICTCKAVRYCSETCRAKDEKDHETSCGLAEVLLFADFDMSVVNATSPPDTVQSESTTKKKKKSKSKVTSRDEDIEESPMYLEEENLGPVDDFFDLCRDVHNIVFTSI